MKPVPWMEVLEGVGRDAAGVVVFVKVEGKSEEIGVVFEFENCGVPVDVLAVVSGEVRVRVEDRLNTDGIMTVLGSGEDVVELAEGNGDESVLGSDRIDSDSDVVEGPPPNPLQMYAPIPLLLVPVVIVFSGIFAVEVEGLGPPVATTVPSLATNVFALAAVKGKEGPNATPVPSPPLAIDVPVLASVSEPVRAVEDSQGEGPSGAGVYGTSAVTVKGTNAFVDADGVSLEGVEASGPVTGLVVWVTELDMAACEDGWAEVWIGDGVFPTGDGVVCTGSDNGVFCTGDGVVCIGSGNGAL